MPYSRVLDLTLLLLRFTFGGLMFLNHGWSKMEKLIWGDPSQFADVFGLGAPVSLGLAVFAEAFCALLVMLGLFTRIAVIPLIITMLIAIFYIHWADPFGDKELALLYLIPYIGLFLTGPGGYSMDAQFRGVD